MERAIFIESQIKNLNFYMKTLEKMILSDIRLMRIVSLYVYAACYRRAKKLVSDS